jgi:hypothetical protein
MKRGEFLMKRLVAATIALSVVGIGAVLAADNQVKVQDLPAAVQKTAKNGKTSEIAVKTDGSAVK